MGQYIDKDALVAEIERRRDAAIFRQRNLEAIGQETCYNEMIANELNRVLKYIDILEVKEVDLDALSVLASHLIACDAHGVLPKYNEGELNFLEKVRNIKAQKREEV